VDHTSLLHTSAVTLQRLPTDEIKIMEECQARNVDKKINATCTVNNLNKMINVFFFDKFTMLY